MKKKNQLKAQELLGDVGIIDSYIYLKPVNHILSGFCASKTPNGVYIYRFSYPLFDRADSLNLNFSERLPRPDGHIDFDEYDKALWEVEYLNRIAPRLEDARAHLDIESLYRYINDNSAILRNEWVSKSYILLLVLMERYSESLEQIDILLKEELPVGREQIALECRELKELLRVKPARAKELVLDWEQEMKKRLGISN
ncbi:hypothetical protein OLMES_1593 [Oleiphilus messinensis]|uniref:Uncharacterized protein n=1 Tax=Oleiphilus messinensis TaxID=141451 RepID=A0A1Y0I5A1_9GAMM|nr:hypothetical protein [Oleiphilus messinensis]ARU55668.1 hypothetical protein OLMES_1593 [Oleiphilus messinensis]